jgi:outer membrane receptor protein involved in Fe transport
MKFFSRTGSGSGLWKALFLLLFGTPLFAQQADSPLSKKITVSIAGGNILDALHKIEKTAGIEFAFNAKNIDSYKAIVINFTDESLEQVLKKLFQHTPLTFRNVNGYIIIQKKPDTPAPGKVTGSVTDEGNGEPIPGVTIRIGSMGTTTAADGSFNISLPAGNYTATLSYIGYITKKISEIEVKDQETFTLNTALKRTKGQLATVEITSSAKKDGVASLYTQQKNNAAISDGISQEQIRRTPDNNVAQVLKRISGLTVQDDKFVTVRGLSERYNNVMMNGTSLPSTEPNRKNFSFDVIPSSLIDNIVVNKTATPDMPAEFAGGLVQINIRDMPSENYTTVTAGSGINTFSVGQPFLATKRGKQDYLGFDDGTRSWWKNMDPQHYRFLIGTENREAIAEQNKTIPNNFGLRKYNYVPLQNYQLGLGRKYRLSKGRLIGVTLAGTYRHEEVRSSEMRYYPAAFYFSDSASRVYNFTTTLGALANVTYQTARHRIAFKNIYNRRFNNETSDLWGIDFDKGSGGQAELYTSITTINSVLHNRLEGEHTFTRHNLKIDWAADLVTVQRDQPDTRAVKSYESLGVGEGYYFLSEFQGFMVDGLNIFNSRLHEQKKAVAVNFTLPFTVLKEQQKIKLGYSGSFRTADYESLALRLMADSRRNPDVSVYFGKPDYELATPTYLQPDLLFYNLAGTGTTGSRPTDNYEGDQKLHGVYLMADLKFLRKFRLVGGIRAERNDMEVNGITFDYATGLPVDSMMKTSTTDWLPSANLTYQLTPLSNLRLAYSKTMSRADFRERSRFMYYEFRERNIYRGASRLDDATITNVDLRYEWYPGPGEVISVSAFYKKFASPVEQIAARSSGGLLFFYFNLRSSENKGFEVDFRKSLGFINRTSDILKNIFISGNASIMKSNVGYNVNALLAASNGATGGNQTEMPADSRNRPLQGLSPYAVNAGIGYFGEKFGINFGYNRFGKRIVAGGTYPAEDQYENPRDVLDMQLSARLLKKKLEVRFNISDILQQDFVVYQNAIVGKPTDSGGGFFSPNPDNVNDPNPNKDPKGTNYNKDYDYTYSKIFKGRNLSFSFTYNF